MAVVQAGIVNGAMAALIAADADHCHREMLDTSAIWSALAVCPGGPTSVRGAPSAGPDAMVGLSRRARRGCARRVALMVTPRRPRRRRPSPGPRAGSAAWPTPSRPRRSSRRAEQVPAAPEPDEATVLDQAGELASGQTGSRGHVSRCGLHGPGRSATAAQSSMGPARRHRSAVRPGRAPRACGRWVESAGDAEAPRRPVQRVTRRLHPAHTVCADLRAAAPWAWAGASAL